MQAQVCLGVCKVVDKTTSIPKNAGEIWDGLAEYFYGQEQLHGNGYTSVSI